ncbi:MAG: MFS transporter [Anaerolineae bacterium]
MSEQAASTAPRLVAFKHRDFRLMWFGDLMATTGAQVQLFAINWHVVQLLANQTFTFSLFGTPTTLQGESLQALGLGLIGLSRVIPIVLFALLGGLLADSHDRRKVLIIARIVSLLLAVTLSLPALTNNITLLAIYLLTSAGAAVNAFAGPARWAIIPNLVRVSI